MNRNRSRSTGLYRWTRQLHLYFRLFICPYILIFAATTLMLNHRWEAEIQVEKTSVPVKIEEGLEDFEQAKRILQQLDLSGEIHLHPRTAQNPLHVRVEKPGERTIVAVDLGRQIADVQRQRRDLAGALYYLHFNPGPHVLHGLHNDYRLAAWLPPLFRKQNATPGGVCFLGAR